MPVTAWRAVSAGRACGLALALASVLLPARLRPQGALSGTVRDQYGRPLSGVEVREVGGERRTESDDRGGFRVSSGAAAGARFEVRRIGFRPETLSVPASGTPA